MTQRLAAPGMLTRGLRAQGLTAISMLAPMGGLLGQRLATVSTQLLSKRSSWAASWSAWKHGPSS